jgi:hypothetical protein
MRGGASVPLTIQFISPYPAQPPKPAVKVQSPAWMVVISGKTLKFRGIAHLSALAYFTP